MPDQSKIPVSEKQAFSAVDLAFRKAAAFDQLWQQVAQAYVELRMGRFDCQEDLLVKDGNDMYAERDEFAPFFSEAYLYSLFQSKDGPRSILRGLDRIADSLEALEHLRFTGEELPDDLKSLFRKEHDREVYTGEVVFPVDHLQEVSVIVAEFSEISRPRVSQPYCLDGKGNRIPRSPEAKLYQTMFIAGPRRPFEKLFRSLSELPQVLSLRQVRVARREVPEPGNTENRAVGMVP